MDEEKLQALFEYLQTKKDVKTPANYQEFKNLMSDGERLKMVYGYLKSDPEVKTHDTFEAFQASIAPDTIKKKDETSPNSGIPFENGPETSLQLPGQVDLGKPLPEQPFNEEADKQATLDKLAKEWADQHPEDTKKDAGFWESLYKRGYDVFANQIPTIPAVGSMMHTPKDYESFRKQNARDLPIPGKAEFSDKKSIEFWKNNISPVFKKDFDEILIRHPDGGEEAYKEFAGIVEGGLHAVTKSNIAELEAQQKDTEKLLENVPVTRNDAGLLDLGYIGGQLGNAVATSLTAITGVGPFLLEQNDAYTTALQKAEEVTGKSKEEIVMSDLNRNITMGANVAGAINTALELTSLKVMTQPIKKLLLRKLNEEIIRRGVGHVLKETVKGTATEGVTEGIQDLVTQISSNVTAGKKWDDINWDSTVESILGGVIGGGAISGISSTVSNIGKSKQQKNASTVRSNQEQVPQGGNGPVSGQDQGSKNIQLDEEKGKGEGQVNAGANASQNTVEGNLPSGRGVKIEPIPSDLKKRGEPVASTDDAKARFGDGERIFGFHEQSDIPMELTSVEQMDKFTSDQLLAYPKKENEKVKPKGTGKGKRAKVSKTGKAKTLPGVSVKEEKKEQVSGVKPDTYIKGDPVKFTGKSKEIAGGLFHEFEILEGHKKGTLGWTQNGPKTELTPKDIHAAAKQAGIDYESPEFIAKSKELTGEGHLDKMSPDQLSKIKNYIAAAPEIKNDKAPDVVTAPKEENTRESNWAAFAKNFKKDFGDEFNNRVRPKMEEFLKNNDLTIEQYRNLGDKEKESINKKWRESDQYKSLEDQTPEKARKEGQFTREGVTYERQKQLEGDDVVKGGPVKLEFANKVNEEGEYAVIEADKIQPSHKKGIQNPLHFIPEAQPKKRDQAFGQAGVKGAQDIAAKLDPAKVAASPNPYSGAPTVNTRGEVVQGNARADALQQYWANNKEKDPSGYKQYLIDNAQQFGLDPEAIAKMKAPVLTRMVKAGDARAIELGQYTASDIETGGKRRIEPVHTVNKLTPEDRTKLANTIAQSEGETLSEIIRANTDKILDILYKRGAITETQLETVHNPRTGEINKEGVEDLARMFRHMMFEGGDTNLGEIFDHLPESVQKGIDKAIPAIIRTKGLNKTVNNALVGYREFQKSGMDDLNVWMNQADIFNDGLSPAQIYSPEEMNLIQLFDTKKQGEISSKINEVAAHMADKEGDMFTGPSKGLSAKEAFQKTFVDKGLPENTDSTLPISTRIRAVGKDQFAVTGDTYSIKNRILALGGVWDKKTQRYIFNNKARPEVEKLLESTQGKNPQAQFAGQRFDGRTVKQVQTANKRIGQIQMKALVRRLMSKFPGISEVVTDKKRFLDAWAQFLKTGNPIEKQQRNKAVDSKGNPVVVYRGQHGAETLQSRLGALSFSDDPEDAKIYATSPNNKTKDKTAKNPTVTKATLVIEKPVMNDPSDPFIEFSTISKILGKEEAKKIALKYEDHITATNNWEENFKKFGSVKELLSKHPEKLDELYMNAFPIFDDVKIVEQFKKSGYDGAIHAGYGEGEGTEYKVFSPEQVIPISTDKVQMQNTGGLPSGFVYGDKIYLNPDLVTLDTAIHEFGHLWWNIMRHKYPVLYAAGQRLIKGSSYLKDVEANPAYSSLSEAGKADEAIVVAIGEKGAEIADKSAWRRFWTDLWSNVKRFMGIKETVDLSTLNLNDLVALAGRELMSPGEIGYISSLHMPETASFRLKGYKVPHDAWEDWNNRVAAEEFLSIAPENWSRAVKSNRQAMASAFLRGVQDQTRPIFEAQNEIVESYMAKQREAIKSLNLAPKKEKQLLETLNKSKKLIRERLIGDSKDIHGLMDLMTGKTEYQIRKMKEFLFGKSWAESGYGSIMEFLTKNTTITGKNVLDDTSLAARAQKKGLTLLDVGFYMQVAHSQERNEQNRKTSNGEIQAGSGMTDTEAQEFLAEIKKSGKEDDLKAFADEIREKLILEPLNFMHQSGMLNTEDYNYLKNFYTSYVPLRVEEFAGGKSDNTGSLSKGVWGTGIKASKGSETNRYWNRVNPVVQLIHNYESTLARVESNEVMKQLRKLVMDSPNENTWKILRPKRVVTEVESETGEITHRVEDYNTTEERQAIEKSSIGVRVGGKQYFIWLKDPDLREMFVEKKNHPSNKWLVGAMKTLQSIYNYQRLTYIGLNIDFPLPNFFRDMQDAMINLQPLEVKNIARKVIKGLPAAARTIFQENVTKTDETEMYAHYLEEMRAEGGEISWLDLAGTHDIRTQVEKEIARFETLTTGERVGTALLWPTRKIMRGVVVYNKIMEQSIRLSTYANMREAGASQHKAAKAAKNVTVNFNKKGSWGTWINIAWLFGNAGIQGVSAMLSSAIKSPKVRAMIVSFIAAAIANRFLLSALADDDDDLKKLLTDSDHNKNVILWAPFSKNKVVSIPVSYNLRPWKAIGDALYDMQQGNKDIGQGMGYILKNFANAIFPMSENYFYPTLTVPLAEADRNKRFYNEQPLWPEKKHLSDKDSELYFKSTSKPFIKLSNMLSEAVEGNDDLLEISPNTFEYAFDYVSGGLKSYAKLGDQVFEAIDGQQMDVNKLPVIRRFVVDLSKQDWRGNVRFRNLYLELNRRRLSQEQFNEWTRIGRQLLDDGKMSAKEWNRKKLEVLKVQQNSFDNVLIVEN